MTKISKKDKGIAISEKGVKYVEDTKAAGFSEDPYYLDDALKAELKEKGLACRFLNAKKLEENGGRHQSGWLPYKRESKDPNVFGRDPDGYIRNGQCILGVKPIEQYEAHKKVLAQRAREKSAALKRSNNNFERY